MKTCSFFGHRNTEITPVLCKELNLIITGLIENGVRWFLFGSESPFEDLCLKTVTELQAKYPEIKRMYVRSRHRYIDQHTKDSLLKSYDDTLMPSGIENAGKACYVERNQAIINASDYCIFYYDVEYESPIRKQSKNPPKIGTKLAYEYATRKKKEIINIFPCVNIRE